MRVSFALRHVQRPHMHRWPGTICWAALGGKPLLPARADYTIRMNFTTVPRTMTRVHKWMHSIPVHYKACVEIVLQLRMIDVVSHSYFWEQREGK